MNMKNRIDLSRTAIIAIVISLALVYPLLWMKMLADPVQYTGADFIAFYAAGRIADNEGAAFVYQLPLQKKYQEEVVTHNLELQEIFPYIHPPFVVPLAQFAVIPGFLQSFQRWAILMIFILTFGILFLVSSSGDIFSRPEKVIFAFGIFLFFPLFQSIILGQDNALVFLGISIWMWGLFQKKDWGAGLGLALTIVRPHFTLFLLLPFLFKQRAILGWFIFFAFILAIISIAYVNLSGIEGFFRILTISVSGEHYKTNEENMVNFIGLARRNFPDLLPAYVRKAGWALYILALLSLCVYFGNKNRTIGGMEIGLASIAGIFFSPHSHVQDMLLFIIPITAISIVLLKKHIIRPNQVILIPLLVSLILLFSNYSPLLLHSVPYLFMIGFLMALSYLQKIPAANT